jgi:hypothetical protein
MPALSLRAAAQQAGVSRSTIHRAVQSGRVSAGRNDDGGYSIDPSELFRVYEPSNGAANGKRDDVQPSATAVCEERIAGFRALVREFLPQWNEILGATKRHGSLLTGPASITPSTTTRNAVRPPKAPPVLNR